MYARLEAVEEELRTSRATAVDAEDGERLREQLRTLTSDLNSMQFLVETLTAENSRLVQENGALGRESLSVQGQRARLTGSQLDQERQGGGQTRDVGEEGLHSSDYHRRLTPATLQTMPSAPVVSTTQSTGLDTLTTSSANRPRTVTFDGPIPQQTVSETGSMTAVVSGGYRERVIGDPLCMVGDSTQPPEYVSSVPLGRRPSLPLHGDHGTGMSLSHTPNFQPRRNGTVTRSQFRDGMPHPRIVYTTGQPSIVGEQSHCGGVSRPQSTISGTHQGERVCTTYQPLGVLGSLGDSLPYCENPQVATLPSAFPQASALIAQPPVNSGVGSVLPRTGVEGSNPTSVTTSTFYPPHHGTVTNQAEQPWRSGVGLAGSAGNVPSVISPSPLIHLQGGTLPASNANPPPMRDVHSTTPVNPNVLTQPGAGATPATTVPHDSGTSVVPRTSPVTTLPVAVCSVPLMGQIPQIPHFTEEGGATGESFSEWHEHFENVAMLAGWNDYWNLVHLTSNLRDIAMGSCTSKVCSKYT